MAHFVAFCIGFQKNIPLQNPPGGGGYMAAQGLYILLIKTSYFTKFLTLESDGQENKISTRFKKFYFWIKYSVSSKTKINLKKTTFCCTWSYDNIQ